MFCSNCGNHVEDGAHFCTNCGAPLQPPGALAYQQPQPQPKDEPEYRAPAAKRTSGSSSRQSKPKDPYQQQIKELKLQIKQLRLDLQHVNQQISQARIQYEESAPFLPWSLRRVDRMIEAGRLWNPAQKRQELQQQIQQLEQQLLGLQQAQLQWQEQQSRQG